MGKHREKITREQSISMFERVGLIQGNKANDTFEGSAIGNRRKYVKV